MEQWASSHLSQGMIGLIVYTDTTTDDHIEVDPTLFSSADFSAITTMPPTYSALSALPIALQGWQKIFDQWKTKGIIS